MITVVPIVVGASFSSGRDVFVANKMTREVTRDDPSRFYWDSDFDSRIGRLHSKYNDTFWNSLERASGFDNTKN
eukprot:scaffold92883_cov55-Attheya_sp.AAC.2